MAGEHILVVDDSAGVRFFLFEFLKNEGYNVETASNGLEAIQKAKFRRHDIILLDLKMPGMSGFEVIEVLKQVIPFTPIVILSAYSESAKLKKALESGLVKYYLNKPFDLDEARMCLRKILEYNSDSEKRLMIS